MPKALNRMVPHQALAICSREQAEQLVNYDHHTVHVDGRPGVMLTFQVRGQPRWKCPFSSLPLLTKSPQGYN